MRITVLLGVICAAIWIGIKLIFFYTQPVGYDVVPLVLLNLLLLISAIAIGLFVQKMRDTEESNGLRDIKNGMTAGVPYALIVSVFIYFYYTKIDPEFYQHRLAEEKFKIEQQLNNPKKLAEIKKDNPEFEVLSKEEIKKKAVESAEGAFSPSSILPLSLLGLILMSAINSIFITVIYRRIVFRPRKQ